MCVGKGGWVMAVEVGGGLRVALFEGSPYARPPASSCPEWGAGPWDLQAFPSEPLPRPICSPLHGQPAPLVDLGSSDLCGGPGWGWPSPVITGHSYSGPLSGAHFLLHSTHWPPESGMGPTLLQAVVCLGNDRPFSRASVSGRF